MLLQPTLPLLLVLGLFALSDAFTMNPESTTVDQNVHPFQDPRDFFPHIQRILARVNTYGLDQDVDTFRKCNEIVTFAEKAGNKKDKDFLPSGSTSRRKALLRSVRNIHQEIAILLKPVCHSLNPETASYFFPHFINNPRDILQGHMARVVYTSIIPRFGPIIQGDGLPNPPKDLPMMQKTLILRVAASTVNLRLYYETASFKEEFITNESWKVKILRAKHVERFKAASEAIGNGNDNDQGTKPNFILPAVHWEAQSYKDHTDAKKGLSYLAAKTHILRSTSSFITNALEKMGQTIPGKGPMKVLRPVQGRMEATRIVQGFQSIKDEEFRQNFLR